VGILSVLTRLPIMFSYSDDSYAAAAWAWVPLNVFLFPVTALSRLGFFYSAFGQLAPSFFFVDDATPPGFVFRYADSRLPFG